MKIKFLGVGEAFDNNLPNTSILVSTKKTNILLDCGYSIPQQYFRLNKKADFLDAIYISHRHADHFFGLPILLMRMWEEGRMKDINIICQKSLVKKIFKGILDIAYKDFSKKFGYKINFTGVEKNKKTNFNDLELSFAPTIHSIENLAIKIKDKNKNFCYSGDGQFTNETESLYKDSDLVIQEAYLYNKKIIGHSCVIDSIEMAKKNNVRFLALTHLQRDFRKKELSKIKEKIKKENFKIAIPEPLEEYII